MDLKPNNNYQNTLGLGLKYFLFAVISTIVNIFAQYTVFTFYNNIYVGLFIGLLFGLITKYILDKNFIFYSQTKSIFEDSKMFFLYSLTGVFTTFIFVFFEISFYYLFKNEYSKYFGGVVGLGIGYLIKYKLDKKFVFSSGDL